MVKSVENGTSLPPFLVKCYEMVNDESTNELISWTESNDSFIIWNESKFASQLLPKYFKHSNFSSFVRQLNIYGFKKIDTDQWQFANESFIKGQKHLLKNITRRKQPHIPVHQNNPPQEKDTIAPQHSKQEEERRLALWKEVENLKTDKNALTQQLMKLSQHQQNSQSKMLLVRKQLQGMEKNQQQMLSFIVMAMQSPEFMVQFFQPKENSNSNSSYNKLSEVTDDCVPSDKMIVPYQPLKDGAPEASNLEDFMEFDFSLDEMSDFFNDIDFPNDGSVGPSGNDEGRLVLPDISENDVMLEELLSSNPSTEIEEFAELDDDEIDNAFDKVEVITKKMGSLASEMR
ncbi:hypothetical protein ABFS83_05G049800 [Erythranthe nasuta]